MQLIAGLGNPGEKYRDNPHNIGFRTLDQLMDALNLEGFQRRFNSEFFRTNENGEVTLMLKPETFMNCSGEAIAECARYFKIPPDKILVISDDLDLPAGKARLRDSGGHGGHNGLRDIISVLGAKDFIRVRIGIGRPPRGNMDVAAWVLKDFSADESAAATNSNTNHGLANRRTVFINCPPAAARRPRDA